MRGGGGGRGQVNEAFSLLENFNRRELLYDIDTSK